MTMKKLTMKLKIGLCLTLSQKTSNASKTTFVFPLPIFNVDAKANGCLRNTLVEVHFGLMHYKIGSPGQTHNSICSGLVRPNKFEDFCKDVEQDLKGKGVATGLRV
jgi:hypothetical protein